MINKKVICVLLILCLAVTAVAVPVGVTVAKTEVKTVVIDPGHGGMDAGVSSTGGVKESDLVLTLSRILADYLESGGFKVVLTRKNKSALTEGKFIKKTDMQKRLKIIERAKPSLGASCAPLDGRPPVCAGYAADDGPVHQLSAPRDAQF